MAREVLMIGPESLALTSSGMVKGFSPSGSSLSSGGRGSLFLTVARWEMGLINGSK